MRRRRPRSTLFPYTTLFRSWTFRNIATQSNTPCPGGFGTRSEEHTSELQSRRDLVCRLLLEKKKEVCPKCDHHLRISSRTCLAMFLDEGEQDEIGADI